MEYKLTEREVAAIEKVLNERGGRSVKICIENGKLAIFAITTKIISKN